MKKIALSLMAHPDDAEFTCAGTLALLRQKGWEIHIATVTAGDCGTVEYNAEEISRIRRAEATQGAKVLNGSYHCLECQDVFIMYDKPSLRKAIELVRRVKPALVFTLSPSDYMIDHEIASQLAQTACFACGIPNILFDGVEPFEPVPYLYYADPLEGKDRFGKIIEPSTLVNITGVIDTKEKMLCCHESQRNWLRVHHGMDEYVHSMREFGRNRGQKFPCEYAEGFRQHLGHGYPHDNILKQELADLVHERREF